MAKQMRLFFAALMSLTAAAMNAQVTTSAMAGHGTLRLLLQQWLDMYPTNKEKMLSVP